MLNQMGNTNASQHEINTHIPRKPELYKGYDCKMWDLSTMKSTGCVVMDHNHNRTLFDVYVKDDKKQQYVKVPYIYMSSSRDTRSWGDYFKVGNYVLTRHTNTDKRSAELRRAVIIHVAYDEVNGEPLIDVMDVKTKYHVFALRRYQYNLDLKYYNVW